MPSSGPIDLAERPSAAPAEGPGAADRGPDPEAEARERAGVVASVAAAASVFLLIQLYAIGRRAPIGHDESVYLLRARYYAGNTSGGGGGGYWTSYRAPGVPGIMSIPMRIVGESVSVSRAVIALFGVATVVLTAFVAGRLGGARAAIVAPWVIVVTAAFTSYSHIVLLDVPGAFCGMLAGALLLVSIRDGEVGWWPALLIPMVLMGGTYVRYGTVTNAGAILAAIVIAKADLLLASAQRWRNVLRLGVVAALAGAATYVVLMYPQLSGARYAPYVAQRSFRDAKGLSPWASYGDLADLVWPNGSRADEAFSWFTLALVAVGVVLTVVGAVRGRRRRAAIVGGVSMIAWIIGLNVGLGQLFGNYLGLGVPFLALLVAPGYAYVFDVAARRRFGRSIALGSACVVAVIGSVSVLSATTDRVDALGKLEVFRAAGSTLNSIAPDQDCAIFSSYVQVAWYSDCIIRVWAEAEPGDYFVGGPDDLGAFPRGSTDEAHVYFVLVENGKRQPVGAELEQFVDESEHVFTIEGRTPVEVRRALATDG